MIRQLHINNYKSLSDLTLEVRRFNVLIGENGCGKSNVLEAIALAAAAAADKLDNEFLVSRGIRVTEPLVMRSAFSYESTQKPIQIGVSFENLEIDEKYTLNHANHAYATWNRSVPLPAQKMLSAAISLREKLNAECTDKHGNIIEDIEIQIQENESQIESLKKRLLHLILKIYKCNKEDSKNYLQHFEKIANKEVELKNFLIYSPENTALRNFSKEGQIEPLGINGEGLLKLLKVIQSESPEQLEEIITCLELFDWFDSLHIPKDLSRYEDKVTITDRFLSTTFDQRSANEGFLFVLFYIALMVSDDTPKIFAIDNIDVALNPKLCTKLIKELVRLAKKYDKQVFVTTHNPAILDGIDLGDDEQRLLVLSRNKQGHTRCKRIELKDKPRSPIKNSKGEYESLRLSEAFLRGYLGGLPKGF
ncbi:MAG: AAA family ATPase [Methylovulum sp.]|nr:AAA family ATPase [Methylovulum sp.]